MKVEQDGKSATLKDGRFESDDASFALWLNTAFAAAPSLPEKGEEETKLAFLQRVDAWLAALRESLLASGLTVDGESRTVEEPVAVPDEPGSSDDAN